MKNQIIRLSVFFSIFFGLQGISAQINLNVEITALRNTKGQLLVELLNDQNKSISSKIIKVKDINKGIVFKALESGQYAIRYFHDENSNNSLDKNFIGIPKEGVGFSNDAYGRFGPKDFDKWLFELKNNNTITLKTIYY